MDDIDLPVGILVILEGVSRAGIFRKVKVATIRRENRLVDIFLLICFSESVQHLK